MKPRRALNAAGYVVVEIWECEWKRMKDGDKDFPAQMEQLNIMTRLDPRGAFLVDESNLLSLIVKRERTFITMISPPSIHVSTNTTLPDKSSTH